MDCGLSAFEAVTRRLTQARRHVRVTRLLLGGFNLPRSVPKETVRAVTPSKALGLASSSKLLAQYYDSDLDPSNW
jgi:hypothetical protein